MREQRDTTRLTRILLLLAPATVFHLATGRPSAMRAFSFGEIQLGAAVGLGGLTLSVRVLLGECAVNVTVCSLDTLATATVLNCWAVPLCGREKLGMTLVGM